ncbi:hypothetical protein [Pseudorhodoferax sp.]|uniref:hypothetical protein n=1 Tax=Pseudorhodoferax sp. TaxID=1993553 RepID=UPI0039E53975
MRLLLAACDPGMSAFRIAYWGNEVVGKLPIGAGEEAWEIRMECRPVLAVRCALCGKLPFAKKDDWSGVGVMFLFFGIPWVICTVHYCRKCRQWLASRGIGSAPADLSSVQKIDKIELYLLTGLVLFTVLFS